MGVNGESMGRKWPKETHVLELITDVPWLLVVQSENRYVSCPFSNSSTYFNFSLLLNSIKFSYVAGSTKLSVNSVAYLMSFY